MGPYYLIFVFVAVASYFRLALLERATFLAQTQKFIKMEYFENCDLNAYPLRLDKFTFTRNGSDLIINGEVIVPRDLKSPTKIQFLIDKCRDKSNPDTCEYYTTWKWDDACAILKIPFVGAVAVDMTPPMTCPIKKNHNFIKDTRLPANLVANFFPHSNPNMLWKVRMTADEAPLTVFCLDFGFRLVNVRVRIV